ncbi:cell division protein ZipA [Pseudomonas linyingensis]|uniref:Cell division protein ZipA n=1 Tax=Pseudomonas linyingensis TaxID=915471 RepID=A0A1H6XCL4_9PSED|nr:cell division protein ZipA [Pseudomonas linyingensis]SEJ25224.1 cell division protein ZipA [Pseudomonas linyingensis]
MDIGLREWLIVIGIMVIGGILFDGWRRMRGSKGRLKLKLDRNAANLADDGDDDPELLGPSRVINKHQEPSLDEHDLPESALRSSRRDEPLAGDLDLELDEPVAVAERLSSVDERSEEPRSKGQDKPREKTVEKVVEKSEKIVDKAGDKAPASAKPAPVRDQPKPQEVLVISVVARDPHGFRGQALLQSILESGLRFGDMDIFHRHESMAGNGEVLFSMANGVKPGTFDLDNIDTFTTRAVSFFLGLPGPRHPKQAFDLMVAAARKLSHELDGELKDEQRSVMTAQTIEHYRQRIVEFERRALMHKR